MTAAFLRVELTEDLGREVLTPDSPRRPPGF
jgi:hypothetical protein